MKTITELFNEKKEKQQKQKARKLTKRKSLINNFINSGEVIAHFIASKS